MAVGSFGKKAPKTNYFFLRHIIDLHTIFSFLDGRCHRIGVCAEEEGVEAKDLSKTGVNNSSIKHYTSFPFIIHLSSPIPGL